MFRLLATLSFGLVIGCSSVPGDRITHSLYTREVVLSRQHPQDNFLRAKLVAIAEDGTTTIQYVETGDTLRTVPGEFFAPGPYGAQGLQLISASADKHEAHLLRTWCETK